MFSLKLNIFSIILVSLKVIHSRVITGTVPLKQPGARCFAQGHNHRLNWERIDGKCFQVNGEKMIGSLTANPFYFICVCCSLTVYHRRSVGYDDTSLSCGGFKLTSPIFNCFCCFFLFLMDKGFDSVGVYYRIPPITVYICVNIQSMLSHWFRLQSITWFHLT